MGRIRPFTVSVRPLLCGLLAVGLVGPALFSDAAVAAPLRAEEAAPPGQGQPLPDGSSDVGPGISLTENAEGVEGEVSDDGESSAPAAPESEADGSQLSESPETVEQTPENQGPAPLDAPVTPMSITSPTLTVVSDGTAVFDADDEPGNDSGANNGIVRTNDTVQYRLEYGYDGPTTDPYLTSTLPAGMEWLATPPQCTGTGTAPSPTGVYDSVTGEPGGDRRMLVCQRETADAAGTESLSPVARVTTGSVNGEVKEVFFELGDADGQPAVTSNTVSTTVSAGAFYDLRKSLLGNGGTTGPGSEGTEEGIYSMYGIGIVVAHPTRTGEQGLKGITPLASPITFTDDLSGMTPNTRLMNWSLTGGPSTGCPLTSGNSGLPASRIGLGGSTAANAVPDTGTITCVPGEPGGTIEITLAGTDTRGLSFPTQNGAGNALPPGTFYVATGSLYTWTPVSDISGTQTVTNVFQDFDPDDVAGNSNFGDGTEPLDNNTHSRAIVAGGVSQLKAYRDFETGAYPPSGSGNRTGDIRANIGSRFLSTVQYRRQLLPTSNLIVCDVFDNTSQRLTARTAEIGPARVNVSGLTSDDYVIEFGAANSPPTTFADARSSTCDDDAAVWSEDPTDATLGGTISPDGYRDTIDRVRVRFSEPLPGDRGATLNIYLRVFGSSALDPENNPDGTLVSNYGRIRSGDTPTWNATTYNPSDHSGAMGDRINLVRGEVRVNKSALEQIPGSGTQVAPGTDAKYRLQPSVETVGGGTPGDPMRDVVVTDLLPATEPRLTVNPLSVTSPDGAEVEFCDLCDGSDWSETPPNAAHGVRWKFGDVTPGTELQPLEYSARVPVDAANGMRYVNTAIGSSPDDPSPIDRRSTSATVQVVAGATVYATKSTATPYRPLAGPLQWDLTVRNATSSPMERLDAIDVLPFNGDDREPASSFSGGFSAVTVNELPETLLAYVTTMDPAALDAQDGAVDGFADPGSPGDSWFVEPGAGEWSCTVEELGSNGCPDASEVTALRFASPSAAGTTIIEAGETLTWKLGLTPSGNESGDTYTNRYQMRVNPEVLSRAVSSPDVPIQVRAPQVDIAKQTCTAADVELCDPADDALWDETHTVRHGGVGAFRLTVTNPGPVAGEVTVEDALPAGLELVDGSVAASTGDTSGFAPVWSVGELAVGQTETLSFQAVIPEPGTQTNEATAVIVDEFDQAAEAADTSELVAAPTDVAIQKDVSEVDLDASGSGTVTYTLSVTNGGAFDETYALQDSFAFGDGIELVGASVENVSPGSLATDPSWNGVDSTTVVSDTLIEAGESHEYRVTAGVQVAGGLAPDATTCDSGGGLGNVGTLLVDGVTLTDPACTDAPTGAVSVEKTGSATVAPDGEITWTIRVTNDGDIDAETFSVRDDLPQGVTFETATGEPTVEGSIVTWNIDRLAAGESVELTITGRVQAADGARITNCATTTAPAGWIDGEVTAPEPGDPACADTEVVEDGGPGNGGSPADPPSESPSGPPTGAPADPTPGDLARTGANITFLVLLAALLTVSGIGLAARRQRSKA